MPALCLFGTLEFHPDDVRLHRQGPVALHAPSLANPLCLTKGDAPTRLPAGGGAGRKLDTSAVQASAFIMVFCEKAGIEFDDELTFWDTAAAHVLGHRHSSEEGHGGQHPGAYPASSGRKPLKKAQRPCEPNS